MRRTARGKQSDNDPVIAWLLDGDPAIVWQVERDLLGAPATPVARSRARVRREGWAARLLAARDRDGRWAGGLYTPKWTSTFYTLQLLAQLGVDADGPCRESGRLLLDCGVQEDGSVRLWASPTPDACVTAMLVTTTIGLGVDDPRIERMTEWLLGQQMDDGGWNCLRHAGATHASFHTTTSVLEALAAQVGRRPSRRLQAASRAGREMLLAHRLFRSHRTGAVASAAFTRFSFPPRWKYDVLRGLDYFRSVDAPWDHRLEDAIALLARRRGADGRWRLQNRHPGATWFELEPVGAPSRWNTLRALRVLAWVARRRRAAATSP